MKSPRLSLEFPRGQVLGVGALHVIEYIKQAVRIEFLENGWRLEMRWWNLGIVLRRGPWVPWRVKRPSFSVWCVWRGLIADVKHMLRSLVTRFRIVRSVARTVKSANEVLQRSQRSRVHRWWEVIWKQTAVDRTMPEMGLRRCFA